MALDNELSRPPLVPLKRQKLDNTEVFSTIQTPNRQKDSFLSTPVINDADAEVITSAIKLLNKHVKETAISKASPNSINVATALALLCAGGSPVADSRNGDAESSGSPVASQVNHILSILSNTLEAHKKRNSYSPVDAGSLARQQQAFQNRLTAASIRNENVEPDHKAPIQNNIVTPFEPKSNKEKLKSKVPKVTPEQNTQEEKVGKDIDQNEIGFRNTNDNNLQMMV